MFAAKQNLPENIKILMECKVALDEDSNEEDEEKEKTMDGGMQMKPKINIDAKDRSSLTALHHAAKRGLNVSVVCFIHFLLLIHNFYFLYRF